MLQISSESLPGVLGVLLTCPHWALPRFLFEHSISGSSCNSLSPALKLSLLLRSAGFFKNVIQKSRPGVELSLADMGVFYYSHEIKLQFDAFASSCAQRRWLLFKSMCPVNRDVCQDKKCRRSLQTPPRSGWFPSLRFYFLVPQVLTWARSPFAVQWHRVACLLPGVSVPAGEGRPEEDPSL